MKKMLIALDDSTSSMQAVEYAASQLAGVPEVHIALVHVLPNLPALFWDEGHILSDDEKKDRKKVVDKWIADRKAKMEPAFRKATDALVRAGIAQQQITVKSVSDSTDVASTILEEARDGGYQTVLVGRCNHPARHFLGSVTGKIINQAGGVAVTVIG